MKSMIRFAGWLVVLCVWSYLVYLKGWADGRTVGMSFQPTLSQQR